MKYICVGRCLPRFVCFLSWFYSTYDWACHTWCWWSHRAWNKAWSCSVRHLFDTDEARPQILFLVYWYDWCKILLLKWYIYFILGVELHQIFFHQFVKVVLFRQIANFFNSRIREVSPSNCSYFYCRFIHRMILDCKLKKSAYILLYTSMLRYFKNIIWSKSCELCWSIQIVLQNTSFYCPFFDKWKQSDYNECIFWFYI